MNYIKPEDIKSYVEQNPTGVAGMSEELAQMVNHFAELIVQECIDVIDATHGSKKLLRPDPYKQIVDNIQEHFGVE